MLPLHLTAHARRWRGSGTGGGHTRIKRLAFPGLLAVLPPSIHIKQTHWKPDDG